MPEPPTILLVDDEDAVQKLLTYPLEREGFRVVSARDGQEALDRFAEENPDLVVLDIMLPRVDGLEVCKRLRARSTVPIIMLTARDDELDKVVGLELGADDYITKPFSIREFRIRVRALLRRAKLPPYQGEDGDELISADGLKIDVARRAVELEGRPVQLTYVEFELLRTMA
jgi:DNA-binding response OmpR family regulator